MQSSLFTASGGIWNQDQSEIQPLACLYYRQTLAPCLYRLRQSDIIWLAGISWQSFFQLKTVDYCGDEVLCAQSTSWQTWRRPCLKKSLPCSLEMCVN